MRPRMDTDLSACGNAQAGETRMKNEFNMFGVLRFDILFFRIWLRLCRAVPSVAQQ